MKINVANAQPLAHSRDMKNTTSKVAARYFVAWELDDMGGWVNEDRVATLEEARQLLANEGCAQQGDMSLGYDNLADGKIFFGYSWKVGLSSAVGEINIQCKNAARRDELSREAAKPLPQPAEFAAEYAATRGKTYAAPTAEEIQAADERDHNGMVDAILREKEAASKNYPA